MMLTRRRFVVGGGWLSLSTLGAGLLAACAQSAPDSPTRAAVGATAKPAGAGRVQLPTYVPHKAVTPDVPGTDVIPDGYIAYPKSPFQSVATPPGDGGDVTVAGEAFTPLIPLEQNTLWQQLNKALNANLKLTLAPFADWAFGKFQALVAGGQLPDI